MTAGVLDVLIAGISPNNPFALLGVIGLDCPGAVQFVPQGSDACRDERLVAVSGAEIARGWPKAARMAPAGSPATSTGASAASRASSPYGAWMAGGTPARALRQPPTS